MKQKNVWYRILGIASILLVAVAVVGLLGAVVTKSPPIGAAYGVEAKVGNDEPAGIYIASKTITIYAMRYPVDLLPNETICEDNPPIYTTEHIGKAGYQNILASIGVRQSSFVGAVKFFKVVNRGDTIYTLTYRISGLNSTNISKVLWFEVHFAGTGGLEKTALLIKDGYVENMTIQITLPPHTVAEATIDMLLSYQGVNYTAVLSLDEYLEERLVGNTISEHIVAVFREGEAQ